VKIEEGRGFKRGPTQKGAGRTSQLRGKRRTSDVFLLTQEEGGEERRTVTLRRARLFVLADRKKKEKTDIEKKGQISTNSKESGVFQLKEKTSLD